MRTSLTKDGPFYENAVTYVFPQKILHDVLKSRSVTLLINNILGAMKSILVKIATPVPYCNYCIGRDENPIQ